MQWPVIPASIRMDHGSSGRKCNSYCSIGRMFRNKIAETMLNAISPFAIRRFGTWRSVIDWTVWHVLAPRSTQRELQIKRMHFRVQWSTLHTYTQHSKCSSALVRTGPRTPLCDLRRKRYIMIKLSTMTIGIRLPIVVLIKIQFKLKCDNAITVDCAFGRWNRLLSNLDAARERWPTTQWCSESPRLGFSTGKGRCHRGHKRVAP